MEVGEMDRKEPQVQVPWIPTTPVKPVLSNPVPICTPEVGKHLGPHANGAVACFEFSTGTEKNGRPYDGSVKSQAAATVADIAGDNGNTCKQTASNNVSCWSNFGFSELLFSADTASANSYATQPGNNDGLKNPFIPSIIHDNPGDLHEASDSACCTKRTSQDTPDNAIKAQSRPLLSMQINMEEKDPGEEKNVPAKKLDNDGTTPNKELCDPVIEFAAVSSTFKENHNPDKGSSHATDLSKTPEQKPKRRKHRPKVIIEGKPKRTRKPVTPKPVQSKENPTAKRKYVRRKGATPPTEVTGEFTKEMPESTKMSCQRSLNFDIEARDKSSAGIENAAALLGKENVVVIQEANVGLAFDLNTSISQASNSYMSLPEDTQAPNTSPSRKNGPGAKPKENPTAKRKYVRRKGLNKSSTPPTQVTGESTKEMMPESAITSCRRSLDFDKGVRDESSADKENATVRLSNEIGVVAQEMNEGLAYDLNTSMKQATNNYMPFPNEQAPNTSPSRKDPPGAKPKENQTCKRKYVRKKEKNKSTTTTEMAGELTEAMMEESKIMSWRSLNFDIGTTDGSSAGRENLDVHIGKENNVVAEETPVGLSYDIDTWMKLALNNCGSLPEDTQAPSRKQNPTGKRKYPRKRGLNKTSAPTEMTGELTEPIMTESTIISCGRSINFDRGVRDESNTCRDSLACHQSTLVKESSYNYMSLPENKKSPRTSLSESNPPGSNLNANSVENKDKRKGLATAQDGNLSNSQISKIRLQMVGSKRKHSGTIKHADNSSMNLIGAQYNGLSSYQTKFWVQFPNIQKKRRTEKGKTSSTHITSSVTTKEVQLTCPQEDAQAHPYASNSSCWIYASGYNAAIVPATSESTENVVHNTQTFDEFILSLRRLTERSKSPTLTCDCGSITTIRNHNTEPNYAAKQLAILDRQTFGDAERPQACMDALVADTHVSLAKKKRNRKKGVLSSSAYSSTNEMQQHLNFALGNPHLPLGMPLDIAREAMWKAMHDVEALAEQFRQLSINTEAKDLALHEQKALVPFQGSFDPIKKQHPRPKVDLDEETDKVWKLLMLDINSHGIDGTNEDKAKWWEEERNVFRGRADSFIARMHLVQGDRRFSKWKGSVVDSVVGVFLTQNVSDHLSSSAFMSLAARFPPKSNSRCKTYNGEGTSLVVNKPQMHIVEPEENAEWDVKLLSQSVYDQSSMTIDIAEHSGEKEAVNSNDSCRTTSSVISLSDESNCRLSESSQRNINEHHSPMSGVISGMIEKGEEISCGEEKSCYTSVRKELNDIVSSQGSVVSSQISRDLSNDQNPEKIGSCSDSNSEVGDLSSTARYNIFNCHTSFSKLLEMVSSTKFNEVNSQGSKSSEKSRDSYDQSIGMKHDNPTESLKISNVTQGSLEESIIPSHEYSLKLTHNPGVLEVNCSDSFKAEASPRAFLKNKDENDMNRPSCQTAQSAGQVAITHSQTIASQAHPQEQSNNMQQSIFNISGQTQDLMQKEKGSDIGDHKDAVRSETNEISSAPIKSKNRGQGKEKKVDFDWDSLRIKAQAKAGKREKTENTMDSLDWDAVRCADVSEIANAIKERGMNNRLAERIKNFLNRLVEEHGSIDLEWLRDVPPDQTKEYLLSIRGLGLKSVECVRLLTLHHLAFPVDTNVGRIAVRLGWVPLQPLPESLQLHLLEMYPVLESIQKYLWPRLCKLDQRTLYELHYQMITFGKVFCTKSKPNCNACPMRGECRHFASAFASARLALPGPEQRSIVSTVGNSVTDQNPSLIISQLQLPLPENTNQAEEIQQTEVSRQLEPKSEMNTCQPIIEEPTTPEPECSELAQIDIEDAFYEDSCEIPTIKLNIEEFTLNLQNYMQENMELQEGEMSKALVALNPQAASIPMPKLKNVSRLRTEHCVYELPDTHPLLEGWDTREPDDPGKYLLAIWTPGETANSIQPPESKCSSYEECGQLCNDKECFSCNSFREANSQIVRGTLLIPCRTAMRGSFPLNGTYFQVNEVFADHDSSLNPISVPRSWIWNLNRRTVYFGTSIPTIFKGLSTQDIQQCFWRGYVCVRGFDRETRAPRPLMARLHIAASKMAKAKEKTKKDSSSENSQGPNPNP